jgi:hypothetical protein
LKAGARKVFLREKYRGITYSAVGFTLAYVPCLFVATIRLPQVFQFKGDSTIREVTQVEKRALSAAAKARLGVLPYSAVA